MLLTMRFGALALRTLIRALISLGRSVVSATMSFVGSRKCSIRARLPVRTVVIVVVSEFGLDGVAAAMRCILRVNVVNGYRTEVSRMKSSGWCSYGRPTGELMDGDRRFPCKVVDDFVARSVVCAMSSFVVCYSLDCKLLLMAAADVHIVLVLCVDVCGDSIGGTYVSTLRCYRFLVVGVGSCFFVVWCSLV